MDFTKSFEHNGQTYTLAFTLNVMEDLQNEYGSFDRWAELCDGEDGEPNIAAIKYGITSMINEGIEIENDEQGTDRKPLSSRQVGRLLTSYGLQNITDLMQSAVVDATKDESKNA